MVFKSCKHEPCLYFHPNYKGYKVYFLRQVDDFFISTALATIANEIISIMDSHMTIKVKPSGIIERFNGVDIKQTKEYIKLSNATYIKKMTEQKKLTYEQRHNIPLPISDETKYNEMIEDATPLDSD